LPKIVPTDWRIQVKIFEKFGCKFERQKGDHLVYSFPEARRPIIIPKYDEIPVTISIPVIFQHILSYLCGYFLEKLNCYILLK